MSGEPHERRSVGTRFAALLVAGVATALLAGALPAAASAADYCVAPNTTCGGTNVATFEQALDLADNATDADRIFLGAATYTAPTDDGYFYDKPDSPVEIVGQGEGQTILTTPAPGGDGVISLAGGTGSSIHDLTIRLPQNAAGWGLYTSNKARRIEVVEDPTQAYARRGVALYYGGTLEDSTVTLGGAQDTTAVSLGPGGGTVRGSVLSARDAVKSDSGGAIERSRLSGDDAGLVADGGVTRLTSSLVRVPQNATGIEVLSAPGFDSTVDANGVTIVSAGAPNTYGAGVGTEPAPDRNADINLTNSIIRGIEHPLAAEGVSSGQATIAVSYSDYDPTGNLTYGYHASITQTNVSNVGDAGFVDAAAGDYHLLPSSPLVDSGDPNTAQGLDFDGNPLVSDGNGDGIARRDLGAFELQPASGATTAGSTPGDAQPLVISGFKVTPALFAPARGSTPLAAKVPLGTSFRYTLSEAAQVRVAIQRTLGGRRQNGRCVRPTPQLRRAKPCTRYRTVGTLTRSAKAGANLVRFSGRIGKRALRPGRYRAVIRATDAAGNRSTPRCARFRIVAS